MSTALSEAKFLTLDTETSGDDPTIHSPVEVGAVLTTISQVLSHASSLVNPGHKIISEAKACHHLQERDVADAPDLKTALKEVIAPAVAGHVIDAYVAHNAPFDSAMLPMLNKKPWLCTLKLAKKVVPGLRHYGNQFLRYELELDVPEAQGLPAHRALADAYVTAALLRHLLKKVTENPELPQDVEALVEWVNAPILQETCMFPKHKDKPWMTVVRTDRQYAMWLLEPKQGQKPLDEDTAYSIRYWLAILK